MASNIMKICVASTPSNFPPTDYLHLQGAIFY